MAGLLAPALGPRWPARLSELFDILEHPGCPKARDAACGEAWIVLNLALRRYVRLHAGRLGRISDPDLEDIAAAKALDLIRKAESGQGSPFTRQRHEIPAFLSTVARNGLVDQLRRGGRLVPLENLETNGDGCRDYSLTNGHVNPAQQTECSEFAAALRTCATQLQPRNRLAWFLRVFYDMTTKEIAHHPEVRLDPGHVDVILQRTRRQVTQCMKQKGHGPSNMPPGTFTELLRAFRLDGHDAGGDR
jgi:RNA polymerase sigma factor (sigma-70 family)